MIGNFFHNCYIQFLSLHFGLPLPKYQMIVEKDVKIPMLDNIQLAADIYRPKKRGKYPVILVRTPYDKSGTTHPYALFAELFSRQGYVVVVQDVRGKHQSEGKFLPYFHEALDGHETINWVGEASWSDGNVAMIGISYLGSCAWLAATFNNPYLRTIIPIFCSQDTYDIWRGVGMPYLKGPLAWLSIYGEREVNHTITNEKLEAALWKLPVNELDGFAVGHQIPFYQEYLLHPYPDEFWEEISANHKVDNFDLPALIIGGWYDPFLVGTVEDYQRMMHSVNAKNQTTEMMIGPWTHNLSYKFEISFGRKAKASILLSTMLKWCDNWLKQNIPETNNGRIRYFIMGDNVWKESNKWPPENVINEKYFLSQDHEKRGPNFGSLSETPSDEPALHRYIYHPRNPVLFCGEEVLYENIWIGPFEQHEVISRGDVLIYNSKRLRTKLVVVGVPRLIIFVSSTALDTDFCAKLCDVHPNGNSYNLSSGYFRMRYRDSIKEPKMLKKDEIYRIDIPFKPIAIAFLKGHRLQLQITSSDFPVHNRNLNTGMSCEYSTDINEAEQTIHFGGPYESCLHLPILKTW